MGYWIAEAEYPGGKQIEGRFIFDSSVSDSDQQYEAERWLVERNEPPCWYSVRWVNDEEEE